MESEQLQEIRSNLKLLPVLQKREKRIRSSIHEAQTTLHDLLLKYKKEMVDVEKVEKHSLSVFLLKTFARYVEKREKEIREMTQAKLKYDEAVHRLEQLKQEQLKLRRRMAELHKEKDNYDAALKDRGLTLKISIKNNYNKEYIVLKEQLSAITSQIYESKEALSSIHYAMKAAREALDWVKKAKTWSNFDVLGGNNIIGHVMKYDRIDEAESCYFILNHQLRNVRQELEDIDIPTELELTMLSDKTKFFDYFLDSVIADMYVLNKLKTDHRKIEDLINVLLQAEHKVSTHLDGLIKNQTELQQKIEDILIKM